jgi:hypothetical protein
MTIFVVELEIDKSWNFIHQIDKSWNFIHQIEKSWNFIHQIDKSWNFIHLIFIIIFVFISLIQYYIHIFVAIKSVFIVELIIDSYFDCFIAANIILIRK